MLAEIDVLPFTKKSNNDITSEPSIKNLREEVEILDDSSLEDDGESRGVEELNLVRLDNPSDLSVDQTDFNSESLEVNNEESNEEGSKEVAHVWCINPPECVVKG